MIDSDPFATGELRRRTLQTWQENPARFREDANTEEDYARGYYRDRVIVELAQNAADAAYESGGAAHFSLHADHQAPSGWSLTVANTGRPLTKDGAESLSSLRTSAKRTEATAVSIGHFGVGFSAVRAVSDDILLRSTSGGLRFSLALAREALETLVAGADAAPVQDAAAPDDALVPAFDPTADDSLAQDGALSRDGTLAGEIARRDGELPVLRLPWPAPELGAATPEVDAATPEAGESTPEAGVDSPARLPTFGPDIATAVTARLRDEAAVNQVRQLLEEINDQFLIALPALTEITVEFPDSQRRFADVAERWHITRRAGKIPEELLATLPVEERERAGWHITWATPRAKPQKTASLLAAIAEDRRAQATTQTLLAPTPTDEPTTLPGLLIASLPLEPTRRRVRPGPVTDWLIEQVGVVGAEHARELPDPLALVPIGLPASPIDRALHESMRGALSQTSLLQTITGEPIAAKDAIAIVLATGANNSLAGATPVVDHAALTELASGQEGIVDIPRHRLAHAAAIGVQARNVADVVTEMPAGRTPGRWRQTYAALNALSHEVGGLAALASLPVPLVNKRVVSGPRGAFLISDDLPDAVLQRLAQWDLRIIAAEASHPLLESLGATTITAGELLDEPVTGQRVADLRSHLPGIPDPDEAEADIIAVMHLVASAVQHLPSGQELEGPIRSWLPDLPLRDDYDEYCGAGGLVFPGSRAAQIFLKDELLPLADDLAAMWDSCIWRAAGVRDELLIIGGKIVLDAWDVDASIDQAQDDISVAVLDGIDEYLDELADYWLAEHDPQPGELLSFELRCPADLDIVEESAWPEIKKQVLDWLDRHEEPVTVPGQEEPFPHYLRWWLDDRGEN